MSKYDNLLAKFNTKKAEKRTRSGSGLSEKIREFITAEKTAGAPIVQITAEMLEVESFGLGPVYSILKKMGINSREALVSNIVDDEKHRADEILIKLA